MTRTWRDRFRILFSVLGALLAFVFFLSPLLWITYSSFRSPGAIFSGRILSSASEFSIDGYEQIIAFSKFPRSFFNSARTSLLTSLLSILFALPGAYGLSRFPIKGRRFYVLGIFSTQMFPTILLLVSLYRIVHALGLLDTVTGVVAGHLVLTLPFCLWMLKGYFDNLPVDIEDSARIDGCGVFQTLIRIVLPIAAPGIFVAGFFAFVVSWGDFLIVSIIAQSQRTATLPLILQSISSGLNMKWGQVAAAAVLTIAPTILLFSFVQRRLVTGMTSGAVKE